MAYERRLDPRKRNTAFNLKQVSVEMFCHIGPPKQTHIMSSPFHRSMNMKNESIRETKGLKVWKVVPLMPNVGIPTYERKCSASYSSRSTSFRLCYVNICNIHKGNKSVKGGPACANCVSVNKGSFLKK